MAPKFKYLVCFSHLRWDFVYQRPQHLMSRAAEGCIVYYVEEPVFDAGSIPVMELVERQDKVWLAVPHLPIGLAENEVNFHLASLLESMLSEISMHDCLFWYYTPMALKFTTGLKPAYTVYDCMDELSAFKFAPAEIIQLEKKLFEVADIVFTGGQSLYKAKQNHHENIHLFPSSIDKQHFQQARYNCQQPQDQACIFGFKLGFYGVIDERFDIELIEAIATRRADWQIILIGPVVKIDPASLPRNANIHYLGPKTYEQLPSYLSGWDVALIPFLLNESTVFISPTKTPEYLAGGKPVVSTAIKDVVYEYGTNGAVAIGKDPDEFIALIDRYYVERPDRHWIEKIDQLLASNSWDHTFSAMSSLISEGIIGIQTKHSPDRILDADNH
ncbi:glycosyltransferase family 1 protein [Dyadobacter luteus]|jgi:glycosyltransferase involved in cell wall biosynthesis|uniref:Glycosyltransferase family 1 protein n=1 Tax=Dyadobacter luteus TaxID=2259619 RepID=A0A3D8YGY1_9BACT|nr:glycosyltransferase family 1 protein [Dyadobacter luteus]REA63659.1 glycosyltransferase family 1 protein [Dyadobacter luteus]